VLKLVENYKNFGYYLFLDSWYNSPDLIRKLKEIGIACTGAVKRSRKDLPEIEEDKKSTNKASTGDINYIVWKDKREVNCLTSIFDNTEIHINRPSGEIDKPKAIDEYSKFMGGVDKLDQAISFYAREKRCSKWWKKIFFQISEYILHNSRIIWQELNNKKISNKEFRMNLIDQISAKIAKPIPKPFDTELNKTSGISVYNGKIYIDTSKLHWIENSETKGDCIYCKKKNIRSRVFFKCKKCEEFLCIECFEKYHIEHVYK